MIIIGVPADEKDFGDSLNKIRIL